MLAIALMWPESISLQPLITSSDQCFTPNARHIMSTTSTIYLFHDSQSRPSNSPTSNIQLYTLVRPLSRILVISVNFQSTILQADNNDNTVQQNLIFFFVPRTSIDELSTTFYAEFRYIYIYRIFLSGRVSKMQRNLSVENSTLRAHEKGRNFPLKCRGFSPVFGIRYIPLHCPAVVCRHT